MGVRFLIIGTELLFAWIKGSYERGADIVRMWN